LTTIVYRAGLVVADSQLTSSNGNTSRVRKLIRLEDGSVFAGAGNVQQILKLREWALSGFKGKRPPKTGEAEAFHMRTDGTVWYYGAGEPVELIDEYTAIGSGGSYAEGAMAFGATALEAIKCAAKHDSNTSGPFQQMRVGPEPAKRKASATRRT
jgi:hypothetical protein